jgi:hypothetical protein
VSRRNTRQEKKLRKLRNALRHPSRSSINLIEWLRDHNYRDEKGVPRPYARTNGEAHRMLLAGRVYVDSHPVGRTLVDDPIRIGHKTYVVTPYIAASHSGNIVVRDASE